MAARKRKRSRRRSRGLRGLGMETPSGYLTVERAGARSSLTPRDGGGGPNRLVIGALVLAAAAGAGWFLYKRFFDKPALGPAPGWKPGGV